MVKYILEEIIMENTKLTIFIEKFIRQNHALSKKYDRGLSMDAYFTLEYLPDWVGESSNEFVVFLKEALVRDTYYADFSTHKLDRPVSLQSMITYTCTWSLYPTQLNDSAYEEGCGASWRSTHFNSLINDSNKWATRFEPYRLIFWWLVILALDTDLYEKYLNYVIDAAHIFRFTEDMMDDWCEAVIYFLNGNIVEPGCNLTLKSDEGKKYFLE